MRIDTVYQNLKVTPKILRVDGIFESLAICERPPAEHFVRQRPGTDSANATQPFFDVSTLPRQPCPPGTVLLTGATGFVGRHLIQPLQHAGWRVVGAARHPNEARARAPRLPWVACDLAKPETLEPALQGCDAALYLVHGLGQPGFERTDPQAARHFGQACLRAGVRRVAYLGGMSAQGEQSAHLHSRHETGLALAASGVEVVELRCSLVIGAGGASWQLVRDLAVRSPVLTVPPWLGFHTTPIGIDDVVLALVAALQGRATGIFDLPGPEALSGRDILARTARLAGTRPRLVPVGRLTPRLAAWGAGLVTRTDRRLAEALLESFSADVVQTLPDFWAQVGGGPRLSFDEAACRALAQDRLDMPLRNRAVEAGLRWAAWPWRLRT